MPPTPASFCSQCGSPLQASQGFCTNCGATVELNASNPTVAAAQTPPPGSLIPPTELASPPPPPPYRSPAGSMYSGSHESIPPPPPPPTSNPYANPYISPGQPGPQSYAQTTVPNPPSAAGYPQSHAPITNPTQPPLPDAPYQVPAYARAPRRNRGCGIASVIILLVIALGVGYFLLHPFSSPHQGNQAGANGTTTSGVPTSAATTGQSYTPTAGTNVSSSEQLNFQVTYASVNITFLSAQSASVFTDDTSTTPGSGGVVRVNFRENNPTASNPGYLEEDSMLLLLPGGTSIQASNSLNNVSPAQGVNRLNWIDFALNAPVALNQLTLRVGKTSENQMDILLRAGTDLSKYQDKSSSPGAQFKYGPLAMTLKTATLSYSYADQQATTGNLYLIVTLAAVNSSTNSILTYPSSYMRLQAGGNSVQPDNTATFPDSVSASTSVTGVVAFLVPQGTTTFTLVMLAQPSNSPPISQVTQNFQIA